MDSRSRSSKSKSSNDDDSQGISEASFMSKRFLRNRALIGREREGIPLEVGVSEKRRVTVSKVIMIFILIIAATGFCAGTYLYLDIEEHNNFEQIFTNYASEIIGISTENVQNTFLAVSAFSESITAGAIGANQQWPNVTIPHFGSRADKMSALAARASVTVGLVIEDDKREGFEAFAKEHIYPLAQETLDFQGPDFNATDLPIPDIISYYEFQGSENAIPEPYGTGPLVVNWQQFPFKPVPPVLAMTNVMRLRTTASAIEAANETMSPKLSFVRGRSELLESQIMQPILKNIYTPYEDTSQQEVVGFVWLVMDWSSYFSNLLPEDVRGVYFVVKSSCGPVMTYVINGLEAEFLDFEDLHDPDYDYIEVAADFLITDVEVETDNPIVCIDNLSIHMYPSKELEEANKTSRPVVFSVFVGAVFFFTSLAFAIYDCAVRSHQRKVMDRVIAQDKIVSNLFPASIRDQLYGISPLGGVDDIPTTDSSKANVSAGSSPDFLTPIFGSKPIANLFLETTVLFADISGFTAWSSAREPSQVFTLLENLYGAFDVLARRHQVFKVETIGDCYVAVVGLPEPNEKHAVVMAKFARDCVEKMNILTAKLEIGLGPDTGDLDLRVGLHSGQVTAGVLRGERSRFQLFGDTVNVASRMESSGEPGRIHISGTTADLLKSRGRSKWVLPRGEILISGKGSMITFWLETKAESEQRQLMMQQADVLEIESKLKQSTETDDSKDDNGSDTWSDDGNDSDDGDVESTLGLGMSKQERLVEWNVELLSSLLRRILAARQVSPRSLLRVENKIGHHVTVLEEFQEIITLPKVTMEDLQKRSDPDFIQLDVKVIAQLRSLLTRYANMYRNNAFHSFEHASHVTASVAKLLSRIVTSDTTNQTQGPDDLKANDFAGHSYGITSDPLTQFAVVFSAIIHDIDHPGVPNTQLLVENAPIASKYKGKSVAEQNSVDLAWDVLLQPEYQALRACIYSDEGELRRFRQILVNVVMATDIADKELGALRKARWNKAFDPENRDSADVVMNRKATIVLEHLIQASDVSHTMQHWQVYKKWNEKFFMECYGAWKAGRAEKDPSEGWYQGEIGFFDFYITPLAKKLDSCGVFGVSSHEYLSYAMANRNEWEKKGQQIVKEYIQAYEATHGLNGGERKK